MAESAEDLESRVLVLAPTGRDAEVTCTLLAGVGARAQAFGSLRDLCLEARRGAAALLVAEGVVSAQAVDPLLQLLEEQPPWSDLPVLILTRGAAQSERALLALEGLGNVVLLDQPVRVAMLVSAVKGALRSRQRQYQLRGEREALRRADRLKDEFLATLAHELRNPLAAICNASYVLSHLEASDPAVTRLHSRITRQAQHLTRMVDDLLDVARITSGKIELRCAEVDLVETARRAVDTTSDLFAARQHELRVTVPGRPLWTWGDPARLEQILVNLLSNAAKYTEPGGEVELDVFREGDQVAVRVADSGIGIAPAMLPHIFDLFSQADRARERAEGGLGIGLSLVRSLVHLHKGSIVAESDGVDRGTRFVVRLPALDEAAVRAPHPAPAPPAHTDTRVLVVDDNADARETLGELLELWSCPYRLAPNGAEALRMLPEFQPSLVLLDLHMPGMSGFDVAEILAEHPLRGTFRLVALTGYGQEEDRRRTRAAGFDGHLTKPIEPAVLRSLLSGAAAPA